MDSRVLSSQSSQCRPEDWDTVMEEVLMIPQKDFGRLMQWYKGQLTENALLNKAARLGAQKNQILWDPNQPAAIVNAKTKSLSRDSAKLTKELRHISLSGRRRW